MTGAVDERPQNSRCGARCLVAPQEFCTNAKEDAPPKAERIQLGASPRKRREQGKPAVLQLRQLPACDVPLEQMCRDGLQAGLSGRVLALVEILEPLTPPCKPDRSKMRISARGHDVGQRKVQIPQGGECRPQLPRKLLERDAAVVIEPAFSDK